MAGERSKVAWIALGAALVALGVIVLGSLFVSRPHPPTPLTPEAKAYFSQMNVSDAKMSVAKNFIGDSIYYLDARVSNQGTKTVRNLRLRLEFVDMVGQMVMRDEANPVNPRTRPLGPGQSRDFRVSFDRMPAEWNQGPPRITVTYVGF